MAMKPLSKAIGLAAMAMSGTVLAAAPTLTEVLDASGIAVKGYVDAAYTYYDIDTPRFNNFDDNEDSFGVKQAGLTISSLPKTGFGALVNVIAGSDADYIHSLGGTDSSGFDLTQAYVQYATGPDNVLGSGFTVMGGKFNTLAGAEVIDVTGNTNISRSIAFNNAIAYTHTGIRLAYAPMDTLTLYAGVNNGWDQQKDQNDEKTFELGLAWSPTSALTWTLQGYSGDEVTDAGADFSDTRTLIDTVLTWKPTSQLSLVLNYDLGEQESAGGQGTADAEWEAIVGYINYQFTNEWRVSVRGEQFDDKDGYRLGLNDLTTAAAPDAQKVTAYTLTVGYAPTANFELRGEVRMDETDDKVLEDGGDLNAEDSQTFMAVEAVYKF